MRVEFIKAYPPWSKGEIAHINQKLIEADDLLRRRIVRPALSGEEVKSKQSPNRDKSVLSAANK